MKKTQTKTRKGISIVPRGINNNNPLNIRKTTTQWVGESKKRQDSAFVVFDGMRWGYRAAFMTIRSYMRKHKLTTIRQIINRWAPPVENNTEIYINTVSGLSRIDRDETLDFHNMVQMLMLVRAMTIVECGRDYDPQKDPEMWKAMYDGYIDARG